MRATDWKATPVFMMDFEGSLSSGVVEFGVVVLQDGGIRETHTALCRPTGHICARDREVHGIGESETAEEAPFSEAYATFVAHRREGIFAAHNRHAENAFLKNTWPLPPKVPDWRAGSEEAQEWGPWIDTLALYRTLYPGLEAYGLGDLVERFSCQRRLEELALEHCPLSRRRPHCALYDALASALLLMRLEDEENLRASISSAWLLQLSGNAESQQELFGLDQ